MTQTQTTSPKHDLEAAKKFNDLFINGMITRSYTEDTKEQQARFKFFKSLSTDKFTTTYVDVNNHKGYLNETIKMLTYNGLAMVKTRIINANSDVDNTIPHNLYTITHVKTGKLLAKCIGYKPTKLCIRALASSGIDWINSDESQLLAAIKTHKIKGVQGLLNVVDCDGMQYYTDKIAS